MIADNTSGIRVDPRDPRQRLNSSPQAGTLSFNISFMIAYHNYNVLKDHMLSLKSEAEVVHEVRDKLRAHRMALAWRQDDLARRSGLGIATLRRFERTGRIGFTGFAKLLVTLGLADKFVDSLPIPEIAPRSIDEFLTKPKLRQRAPRKQRG